MAIKTLRRALIAGGSIRLVQRNASKPFVVIVDVPAQHVTFETYAHFTEAAASFSSLCGRMKLPSSTQAAL